jgi:glycosyl transferase family 25
MKRIKTFAINVASNTYRRDHILSQSEKSGLDIRIFDAITPDTINSVPNTYNEQKTRQFTGRELMETEKACALSHIQLWRDLQTDADADYYIILEDDIEITHNIGDIIQSIDFENIDFLKFSGQQTRPMKKIKSLDNDFTLYRYAFGPLDAAAYLISKSGARILERYCQTLLSPIDILMDRSYDHGVPIYGVLPYAGVTQFNFDPKNPLYTDIGVRDAKYAPNITRHEKLCVKMHRLIGSFKRHLATLRLYLVK